MTDTHTLVPARQLAATNKARYPNESPDYRTARQVAGRIGIRSWIMGTGR